ncbi:MAG: efflux RND transporter permease subunit, partial [Porphyromonadaceae bacterium]|nr:efflux RND transporter permease subunit [Porphyromonadaceae bacterium]
RGNGIKNSVVMSGKSRLRPVLMTTATTVLGLLPMAIGIGQGSEMWKPMGIAVVSGLVVSTLITLILIPTIYTTVLAMDTKKERKKLVKKHELKERLEKEQQD